MKRASDPRAAADAHLDRLRDALRAEAAHAEAEHRRLCALPRDQRVALGLSIGPLRGLDDAPAGRARRVLLRLPRHVTPHDGITRGDAVRLRPWGADTPGQPGRCVAVDDGDYEVLCDGAGEGPWELQRDFDPTTFRRYDDALRIARHATFPLREALLTPPSTEPPRGDWPGLHPSQAQAADALVGGGRLVVIHGPPGTGKTHTIVAAVARVAAHGRVLVAADSNAAVDHLALGCAAAGLHVVRLGSAVRASDPTWPMLLDARIAAGLLGPAIAALDRDIARADDRRERGRLLRERDALWEQARGDALAAAQVIAATLGTLAGATIPECALAVVDEATQALEPGIWAVAPRVPRLALVGDPEQLGPVVTQPGNPLERSALARLVAAGAGTTLLTEQRRMHRAIQALVDDRYDGRLVAHPAVAAARLCDLPGVQTDGWTARPAAWLDTAGAGHDEQRDPVTGSWSNPGEAALVERVVARWRAAGVSPDDIGVLAPYSAQVTLLRARLPGVEVATVNAFQGREKQAIVCSWVRSNDRGELGFVADGRRLTVALSRARRALVLVGDSATLGAHPRFAALLAALEGAHLSVWSEDDLP